MKNLMKQLPALLAFGFIGITVVRIASFASDGSLQWNILGTAFAIMLAMSVYVSSFFLGYANSRNAALVAIVFFGAVDITFNFAETLSWSVQSGRWNQTVDFGFYNLHVYRFADVIYGLFPTMAAALLGYLMKFVSQIPKGKSRPGRRGIFELLADLAESQLDVPENVPARSGTREKETEPVPEHSGTLPKWLPAVPQSKKQFVKMYRSGDITLPEETTAVELSEYLPVGERATRNWIKAAQNGNGAGK